jgi:hypothetical protein
MMVLYMPKCGITSATMHTVEGTGITLVCMCINDNTITSDMLALMILLLMPAVSS